MQGAARVPSPGTSPRVLCSAHTDGDGAQTQHGCRWLWGTLLQSQNDAVPTLRTRNTLPQQDCLPKRVKSFTCGIQTPRERHCTPHLNRTAPGSPQLLGRGKGARRAQGEAGSVPAVPQTPAGEAAGPRTGGSGEGAHTAPGLSLQVAVPTPAPPCCHSRAILTSQCRWGGSAGTHRSRPSGPGFGAG